MIVQQQVLDCVTPPDYLQLATAPLAMSYGSFVNKYNNGVDH